MSLLALETAATENEIYWYPSPMSRHSVLQCTVRYRCTDISGKRQLFISTKGRLQCDLGILDSASRDQLRGRF